MRSREGFEPLPDPTFFDRSVVRYKFYRVTDIANASNPLLKEKRSLTLNSLNRGTMRISVEDFRYQSSADVRYGGL